MKSRKEDRGRFILELEEVIPRLPKCYAVLVGSKLPNINRKRIYNVRHSKVIDWAVLQAMKDVSLN